MQKLYCYVDETGQDPISEFFIVVAVVTEKDRESIRKKLEVIERQAGTNRKKWHKVRHENRMRYLDSLSEPLIRLADMWAGCIRSALLGRKDAQDMVKQAKKEDCLRELKS